MARTHELLVGKIIELSKKQITLSVNDRRFSDDDEPYAIEFKLSKRVDSQEFHVQYAFTHKELDKLKVGAGEVISRALSKMEYDLEKAINDYNI